MQVSYQVPKPERISSAAGLWLLHSGVTYHAQAHLKHDFFILYICSISPPRCFHFSISSTTSLLDAIFALHCLLFSFLSSWIRQSPLFSDAQEQTFLESSRNKAPQNTQDLRSECQSHRSQSREDAIKKLTQAFIWSEKHGIRDAKTDRGCYITISL